MLAGMARFYFPADLWAAGELPESEGRHASQVLRLGPGDRVEVFDGSGRVAEAELTEVGKRAVRVKILREWREEQVRPEIHLLVALIKNERFDWLVQKATELGAASIRPVSATRSVVKVAGKDAEKRRMKWQQTSIEAAKQCGHVVLPELFPVKLPDEAFRCAPPGLKGIPSVDAGGLPLKDFFTPETGNIAFAIGPEGDWTPEEMSSAQAAGFVPLNLGRHVLRSETAALHVLSASAHHFLGGAGGMP